MKGLASTQSLTSDLSLVRSKLFVVLAAALAGSLGFALLLAQQINHHLELLTGHYQPRAHANVMTPVAHSAQPGCDPYLKRGLLHLNFEDVFKSEWQPLSFDEECQPINWMAEMRSALAGNKTSRDVNWIRNRSIALLGDSLDRFQVEDFCSFFDIPSITVPYDSPLNPPIPQDLFDKDLPNKDHDWTQKELDGKGRPTVCQVEALNLTLVSAYHWSVASWEDKQIAGFLEHKNYQPPAMSDDRLRYILLPLLNRLGHAAPDLFSFNTYAWDVSVTRDKTVRQHHLGGFPQQVNISEVRLFGQNLRSTLEEVVEQLPPSTPLLYRPPHALMDEEDKGRIGAAVSAETYNVLESITGRSWSLATTQADLDSSELDSIIKRPERTRLQRMRVVGPGPLVNGFKHKYRDHTHLGPEMNYVGANILLSELYRAVHTDS